MQNAYALYNDQMFSSPQLQSGEVFPSFANDSEPFQRIIGELGLNIDSSADILPQLAAYAIGWIEDDLSTPHPVRSRPYHEVPAHKLLADAGLVHAIPPQKSKQDFVVIDGGSKAVYDYRLDYADELRQTQSLITSTLTVFGGQRLRFSADDKTGLLEDIAGDLITNTTRGWTHTWLQNELYKGRHPNSWQRSFATEHEIAILALIQRYGDRLRHERTIRRDNPIQLHESVPIPTVAAEEFSLDEELTVYALDAPAITREHAGRKHPIEQARPTGRSCFFEWEALIKPPMYSSVLLVSHNPNIYRSWLDLVLAAKEINRADLILEGAGPSIEPQRSFGYLLRGLGDILINFYNYQYEGGLNVPSADATRLQPKFT